jgi:hypothetical protein
MIVSAADQTLTIVQFAIALAFAVTSLVVRDD